MLLSVLPYLLTLFILKLKNVSPYKWLTKSDVGYSQCLYHFCIYQHYICFFWPNILICLILKEKDDDLHENEQCSEYKPSVKLSLYLIRVFVKYLLHQLEYSNGTTNKTECTNTHQEDKLPFIHSTTHD